MCHGIYIKASIFLQYIVVLCKLHAIAIHLSIVLIDFTFDKYMWYIYSLIHNILYILCYYYLYTILCILLYILVQCQYYLHTILVYIYTHQYILYILYCIINILCCYYLYTILCILYQCVYIYSLVYTILHIIAYTKLVLFIYTILVLHIQYYIVAMYISFAGQNVLYQAVYQIDIVLYQAVYQIECAVSSSLLDREL